MTTTSPWYLSQKDLQLLTSCPLQFQHNYGQKLASIPSLNQLQRGKWGQIFHTFMQQNHLKLPVDAILDKYPKFHKPFLALMKATDDIWKSSANLQSFAEYPLTLHYQNYIFTTIFDLLILTPEKAIIFDWKTYLQPPASKIEDDWQTKLYLYVLAEKFNYLPEQISFTYWFVKLPHEPQSYTVQYNKKKHQKILQQLGKLLNEFEAIVTITDESTKEIECLSNRNCEKCPYNQSLSTTNFSPSYQINFEEKISLSIGEVEEINPH